MTTTTSEQAIGDAREAERRRRRNFIVGVICKSSSRHFIVISSFQIRKMQPFRVVRLIIDEWAETSKTKFVNFHFTDNSQFVKFVVQKYTEPF